MLYSKKLYDSGLLNHARKSGSFYLIMDELARRDSNITLSVGETGVDTKVFAVMQGKKTVGTIQPVTPVCAQAVDWVYIDVKDSSLNITPATDNTILEG